MPKFTLPEVNFDDMTEEETEEYFENSSKFQGILIEAQRIAIRDKATQYYKKLIDEGQCANFSKTMLGPLKQLATLQEQANAITDEKQGNNDYAFFTINVKPEVNKEENLEAFDAELKDFTETCKYLKDTNHIYSIEQRSENETVDGLHAHILFDKNNISPSKLQRAFKNRFFPKWCSATALDYRYIKADKWKQKADYIKGIKEEPKMLKVKYDKIMKDKYDIPVYYEHTVNDLNGGVIDPRD